MIININIKPNSNEQSIEETETGFVVRVKSPAQDNKANVEMVKLLKKHFNAKEIKIKNGFKSKKKKVEVMID
jgi:uncharacterized protein (TIGR00251 family)